MNMPAPRILVVDDEPDLRALYEITLMRAGYQVFTAEDMEGARALLRSQQFDLLITDISLADFEIGLRDFVSNVENAYWDLYFAYRNLGYDGATAGR